MKKSLLSLIAFVMFVQSGMAQANTIGTTGKWGSQIFLSDVNGRAFENKYADITGSAYFLPDYKYSTIIMSDGRKYENVRAKLNLRSPPVKRGFPFGALRMFVRQIKGGLSIPFGTQGFRIFLKLVLCSSLFVAALESRGLSCQNLISTTADACLYRTVFWAYC